MNGTNNQAQTSPKNATQKVPIGITLSDIEHVSPALLSPHPLNARVIAEEPEGLGELREDIRSRGILVPLIAGVDGTLLVGHNRLRIALELELPLVPVQRVPADIDPEREREFLIKDNVLRRQLSAQDKEKLIRELYMEEITQDRRGGDRKSVEIKRSTDLLILPLPQRIEQETGIAAGTARRIITGIRRGLGLVSERSPSSPSVLSLSSETESTQIDPSSSETKNHTAPVSAERKKSVSRSKKALDPMDKVLRHLNSIRRTAGDARTARATLEYLDEIRRELRKLAKG